MLRSKSEYVIIDSIKHIFYESKADAFPVFLIFQKSMLLSTDKEREVSESLLHRGGTEYGERLADVISMTRGDLPT